MRTGRSLSRRWRLVGSVVSPVILAAAVLLPTDAAFASSGAAPLQPAAGQYVPVTPVQAMDTQDGTGGVPVAPAWGSNKPAGNSPRIFYNW